jgi:membrane-bound ClpP family serine protease
LLGIVLLGVEIFVLPGFGITGVAGILLILLGLALAVVQQWPQTQSEYFSLGKNIAIFAGGLIVSLASAFMLARYLPHIPYANRLVLAPPDEQAEMMEGDAPLAQPAELLGAIGVAATTLRPAGKARFGDQFIDVVAEGYYVDSGTRVQIIEIDGVRVVVKPV